MSNFLHKLGPGDYVVLRHGYHYDKRSLVKVKRVTKTQIILEDGLRFSKKTGREIGASGWYAPIVEEATREVIEEIKHENYKMRLLKFIRKNVRQADLETLELMVQILKTYLKRKKSSQPSASSAPSL